MTTNLQEFPSTHRLNQEMVGRVIAVTGAQVTIGITTSPRARVTVGKCLKIITGDSAIVGIIIEVTERPKQEREPTCNSIAQLDLVGEIITEGDGAIRFVRGVTEFPIIGELAVGITDSELRSMYSGKLAGKSQIGTLKQDPSIGVEIDIDSMVSKHFAVIGTTGVGKSNGIAVILQQILAQRPDMRIFLIDPHNEYGNCFGDKAQLLTPHTVRLPFWLFSFEEIVDTFFAGRPVVAEEVEILSEVIPLAKAAFSQFKSSTERSPSKNRNANTSVYSVDTPVPYRIEDMIALIDERMGKLENRSSRMIYNRLIQRIQSFRNHPRYAFMFDNATVGGDTMLDKISQLFRLGPGDNPMTIMQLAGFPAEVVDSVVSVLGRMAFDLGLWSDGALPILFVCEEAHRYAPADIKAGFGPTRRALSRIAKEGRKYDVALGLVTQHPAEIDPNIISQCSTLFVMRLANDRDQDLIRSAVPDATASLLDIIPSLGTAEVFAFGAGLPLPARMKFNEVPALLRPNSDAGNSTRTFSDSSSGYDQLPALIEQWRASTMSQKPVLSADPATPLTQQSTGLGFGNHPADDDVRSPTYTPASTSSPFQSAVQQPTYLKEAPLKEAPVAAALRPSILRKPIGGDVPHPMSAPTRWR